MMTTVTSVLAPAAEATNSPAMLYAQIILTAVLFGLLLAKELVRTSAGAPIRERAQAFDALIAPLLLASLGITAVRVAEWLADHAR